MRLPRLPRRTSSVLVAAGTALAAVLSTVALATPAQAGNRVTPGNFTGYGFDQCVAPTQYAMDRWLTHSPFFAIGIYISGDSRGCRDQPNLTASWVSRQLASGWRLLPITLGPQASCTTRDRYLQQVRINPDPATSYRKARLQGRAEADKAVRAAGAIGIVAGSTLWYDIEAFDTGSTNCRESALSFLSAWTVRLHKVGYVSGVYSSAASGIDMLDDARANRPGTYTMPDNIWIADWNGRADVRSSYVRDSGWMPHRRVHQYRGPHRETHGGVTIDIDSNWLDLGKGSTIRPSGLHCGTATYDFMTYPAMAAGTRLIERTKALQCRLTVLKMYDGPLSGRFDAATTEATKTYQRSQGMAVSKTWSRTNWIALLSEGARPVVKYGSANGAVRRLQRSLNAAGVARLAITGVMAPSTVAALRAYQQRVGTTVTGVAAEATYSALARGKH